MDLELLAAKVRAGAALYDRVEGASAGAADERWPRSRACPTRRTSPDGRARGRRDACARLAPRRTGWPTTWLHDPSCWRRLGRARGRVCARRARSRHPTGPAAWPTRCTGRRLHCAVHADVVGRGPVARSTASAAGYDDLVAGQRRARSSRLLADPELVGADAPAAAARSAGRDQQAELAALHRRHARDARPGRRARAADRRQVVGSRRPGPARDRVPAGARSTRARASWPPCCRCSPRPGGPPASGPARPPAGAAPDLVRQWWALLTSDEQQRLVAPLAVARSARSTGSPARSAAPPTSTRLDHRRRDAPDPNAHSPTTSGAGWTTACSCGRAATGCAPRATRSASSR